MRVRADCSSRTEMYSPTNVPAVLLIQAVKICKRILRDVAKASSRLYTSGGNFVKLYIKIYVWTTLLDGTFSPKQKKKTPGNQALGWVCRTCVQTK